MTSLPRLLVAAWVGTSVAFAQTVVNPTAIHFYPSADHAVVTAYEIGYFQTGPGTVENLVYQIGIGRPVCTPECVVPLPPWRAGRYVLRIRAQLEDPLLVSAWSAPSNPFGYPAEPPVGVTVQR